MTFRGFLERDAGVFDTKEGCHVASNVLLLTGTNCSSPPNLSNSFPARRSGASWSVVKKSFTRLSNCRNSFLFTKKEGHLLPRSPCCGSNFAERVESSTFVDNSQPDGHLQFDHDPKSQTQTQLQDRFVSKVATWNSQFRWIRPAWQPCTKLRYQYHYGCMCDVTAL